MDHDTIILAQLLVHMFGGMGQQVAMLVNGAALDRQVLAPQCVFHVMAGIDSTG